MTAASFQITTDSRADWHRTIVAPRRRVDLLARFVDDPDALAVVQEHEAATRPASAEPAVIVRPFEDAAIYDAIAAVIRWPFDHPCRSRYSDGRYGVWYGARDLETSIRETVHHFRQNTLMSAVARTSREPIVQERRVHLVQCGAMLVDLRARCREDPRLTDPVAYAHCQRLGARLRDASQPGVITLSARHSGHDVVGVFDPDTLSDPRMLHAYTYRLDAPSGRVTVERVPRQVEVTLDP